jgi:hypothetical protein
MERHWIASLEEPACVARHYVSKMRIGILSQSFEAFSRIDNPFAVLPHPELMACPSSGELSQPQIPVEDHVDSP